MRTPVDGGAKDNHRTAHLELPSGIKRHLAPHPPAPRHSLRFGMLVWCTTREGLRC